MVGYKGAGVVFTAPDEDGQTRILLGQRTLRPYAGYWSLPGGGMDEKDGGDFRACAAREAFEETVGLTKLKDFQRRFEQRLASSAEYRVRMPLCFDYRSFVIPLTQIPDLRLWPNTESWSGEFRRFGWFKPDRLPPRLHPFVEKTLKFLVTPT
jgi:8-oxo-dGTP pyrophosphatase MutT (NUDIX family)